MWRGCYDDDEWLNSTKSKLSHVDAGKVPGYFGCLNLNDSVNSLKPFYMLEAACSRSMSGLHTCWAHVVVERGICEGCQYAPICTDVQP